MEEACFTISLLGMCLASLVPKLKLQLQQTSVRMKSSPVSGDLLPKFSLTLERKLQILAASLQAYVKKWSSISKCPLNYSVKRRLKLKVLVEQHWTSQVVQLSKWSMWNQQVCVSPFWTILWRRVFLVSVCLESVLHSLALYATWSNNKDL